MKLISTPHKRRNRANELKEAMGLVLIVADEHWTIDCFIDISDDPVVPAPDLIAKSAESAKVATSYRTLNRHPSRGAVPCWDGPRVFDHEAPFGDRYYQG
ncbi:MAG: hypothetical protein M3P01_10470 [Actinomycetota bacterium]|nr:hypothetical protein [Actinomycetota bacterium]